MESCEGSGREDDAICNVNANDATRYPDDGDAMKARARERGFPFAYVRDDS